MPGSFLAPGTKRGPPLVQAGGRTGHSSRTPSLTWYRAPRICGCPVRQWRIPNFLLEPRGTYFHEPDERIERLSKYRSLVGGAIVIGMIVYYSGLSHTGYTRTGGALGGADITLNTPEGNWLTGIVVTISAVILVIPVVSLILVLTAEHAYRRATLYQLRWLAVAAGSFAGLCAATSRNLLVPSTKTPGSRRIRNRREGASVCHRRGSAQATGRSRQVPDWEGAGFAGSVGRYLRRSRRFR